MMRKTVAFKLRVLINERTTRPAEVTVYIAKGTAKIVPVHELTPILGYFSKVLTGDALIGHSMLRCSQDVD